MAGISSIAKHARVLLFLAAFPPACATSSGLAQDAAPTREQARALLQRSDDDYQAQRYAIAARGYLELYRMLTAMENPRASVALWNVALSIAQIPGREREARDMLQRFLHESRALANEGDREVHQFRSQASERIAELDARIALAEERTEEPPRPAHAGETDGGGASPQPVVQSGPDLVGPAIVLGVAGAGLVTFAIGGGLALAEHRHLADGCGAIPSCTDAELARLGRYTLVADIGWITAAVAAAAGAIWLAVALTNEDGFGAEAAPRIALWASPEAAGLVMAGHLEGL